MHWFREVIHIFRGGCSRWEYGGLQRQADLLSLSYSYPPLISFTFDAQQARISSNFREDGMIFSPDSQKILLKRLGYPYSPGVVVHHILSRVSTQLSFGHRLSHEMIK